jgi:hypothetical protein
MRIDIIAIILREYGFNIKTKGDLIIARLANPGQDEIEDLFDKIGQTYGIYAATGCPPPL